MLRKACVAYAWRERERKGVLGGAAAEIQIYCGVFNVFSLFFWFSFLFSLLSPSIHTCWDSLILAYS